jgi:tetratricopeptide (TPR) repeat protein
MRRIVIVCIGFAALISAQNRVTVEGRLSGGGVNEGLRVEVAEASGMLRMAAASVNADSSFRIEIPAEARSLEFRVLNRYGEVIQVSHQWLTRGVPIELRLKGSETVSARQAAISLKRLAFRPSKENRRAFSHIHKLNSVGKKAESVAALNDILKAEPNWFEAWVELANQQASLGAHSDAVGSLQRALAIDPNAAELYASLGLALIRSRRASEAGQIAQAGLKLNPGCIRTKYVLGLAIASERPTSPSAVALLDEVQSHFPEAMVPLAVLLLKNGQFEASRDTAWRYLHIAKAPRAELAGSIWREASSALESRKKR